MNTARLIQGDPLAEAALAEVHERAAAAGLVDHAARALINLAGTVSEELARYADAAPLLERALDYAARQELDGWTGWLLGARAKIRLERCEWKGALADAHAALERSDGLGVHAVLPMVVLGRMRAACGAVDALSILDEADPATHHDATHRRGVPVSLRLKASGSTRRLSCGSSGRSASRRWR